jgi:hypothetical protein
VGYATHIEVGIAAPVEIGPVHNLYVTDPWRVMKVRANGTVVTLAGYRHKSPPSYWHGPQELELVGDWSAIPTERQGFREIWGMCWDSGTFASDETQPRIPQERNLHPHVTGVVMFVADSQNNRVCKLEFDPRSHATPPKVTEFITAPDCWDCMEWNGQIIVSVRGEHKINAYDIKTGALIRTIVQGEPLAVVDRNRFVVRKGTIDAIRAQDVVLPEGLYVIGDWLYYGSAAMAQVKRVHLVDGRIETLYSPPISGGSASNYYKIAVSDGTAGPEGQIFISNWTVQSYGAPRSIGPDGKVWSVVKYHASRVSRGRSSGYASTGYSGAVAARYGRIVWGGANEGLRQFSIASTDAPIVDKAKYARGREAWAKAGYNLSHGAYAESFFGLPLPWGEDADMDYFMQVLTE